MYNYLDQLGRQEFVRQHFDQLSQASERTCMARKPGNPIFSILHRDKFTVRSKSRLALITAAVLLAALVINDVVLAAFHAISSRGSHLVR